MFSILVFWISIGATEGWKWREMFGKKDDSIITEKNYHVWRAFTNLSVLTLPFEFMIEHFIPGFLVCFLFGWYLYERMISWVQCDDPFALRQNFKILNLEIKRIDPGLEILIVAALSAIILILGFI